MFQTTKQEIYRNARVVDKNISGLKAWPLSSNLFEAATKIPRTWRKPGNPTIQAGNAKIEQISIHTVYNMIDCGTI